MDPLVASDGLSLDDPQDRVSAGRVQLSLAPSQKGLELDAFLDPDLAMLLHFLQHRIGEALAVLVIARRAEAALAAPLAAAGAPAAAGLRHLDYVGQTAQGVA
ncbi:hypothetical protein KHP60_04335 [Microvirga sp. 3-52]|uniref:hypothetical protein n=1 Tax=Microvirga sp. 3-52 TaxID=2792425 RepID=UPI001AC4F25B|nr:hypothetical protein [Microvirga sp. 3-52]MBO1904250.1 hypothetical protein [Microvirga sp. 3-52]MBS7451575.1 hypothetical protein [Microvirga sp. 3-52]